MKRPKRNRRIQQRPSSVLRLGQRRTGAANEAPAEGVPASHALLRWGWLLLLLVGALYLYAVSVNILVLGTDDVDYSKHTDTIMLIHWRPLPRRLALLSIPRDTLIRLPKRGVMKINAVYAYGHVIGTPKYALAMTRAAIENLLEMKMHYTVHIRYSDFIVLVDALGGVPLYVAKAMHYVDQAGGVAINLEPGYQLLDGQQSLDYVRFRHDRDGDIGRIRRQQQFLKAFVGQMVRLSRVPRTLAAFATFLRRVETDFTLPAAAFLALEIKTISHVSWRQAILPGQAEFVDGKSYWKPDYAALRHVVADLGLPPQTKRKPQAAQAAGVRPVAVATEVVAKTPEPTPEPTVVPMPQGPQPVIRVLNGCGVPGVASQVQQVLRATSLAIRDEDVTNAPSFDFAATIVKSQGKNLPWARRIATILGLGDERIQEVPASVNYPTVTVVIGSDFREWLKPR